VDSTNVRALRGKGGVGRKNFLKRRWWKNKNVRECYSLTNPKRQDREEARKKSAPTKITIKVRTKGGGKIVKKKRVGTVGGKKTAPNH